jgi:hypothetical protein
MADASTIIDAGLLGDLINDRMEDEWAIDLGHWLEVARAASNKDTRIFDLSDIHTRHMKAIDAICGICVVQNLSSYDDSAIAYDDGRGYINRFVHDAVRRDYGDASFAFVCIGQCA